MVFVDKLGVNTLYIVVINKVVELKSTHIIQSFYCVGNFKVVVVVMTGVQGLVQVIVGHGVQGVCIGPAVVVAVDNLTHQPKVRLNFICHAAHTLHVIKV